MNRLKKTDSKIQKNPSNLKEPLRAHYKPPSCHVAAQAILMSAKPGKSSVLSPSPADVRASGSGTSRNTLSRLEPATTSWWSPWPIRLQ